MPRPRVALIAGAVLFVAAPTLMCGVGALLRPGHPWRDVSAEQATWHRTLTLSVLIGSALLVTAWILLAYGFVALRRPNAGTRARAGSVPSAGGQGE